MVNQGDYLQINTSKSGNNVQFNNAVYNLQEVRIYQPSLHTFNGGRAHAEIMIHHVGGGNNLLVCIPIKTANGASKSVDFFNSFIPYIPQRDGQSATVNVSNWSLNNVIPKGPYYFYRGTLPYPPCTGVYNIIVFDIAVGAQMSTSDFEKLSSLIQANSITIKSAPEGGLFYNSSGTIIGESEGDDIYIDCQPVSEKGPITESSTYKKLPSLKSEDFEKLLKNPAFDIAAGVVILIIFKKLWDWVYGKVEQEV